MSDDTDFDSAFAEATDVTVDTQQPVTTEPAAGGTETPPEKVDTAPVVDAAATGTEPTKTPEELAAAAEATGTDAVVKPEPVVPAVTPEAAPAPAPVVPAAAPALDPKFLAQAIAEANQNIEAQKKAAAPAEPAKTLTSDDFLDDNDRKAITTFKEEWPTEFVAVNKMFTAQLKAEMGNYKAQLAAELNGVLAPLYQSVGSVQANSHMGSIKAAHPDAETIVSAVVEWVKTQPSYMQAPMMTVLDKGNAAQINELLTAYKQTLAAPGAAPVTPAPAVENNGTPPKKGVDPAAVAALAAVPAAQRPTPAARPSENDFDAAFEEALAQA